MEITFLWAGLAALVAGLLRGAVGFGSAMILVPILSTLYSPVQAVSMVLIMECLVSLPLAPAAIKRASFRDVSFLLIFAVIGAIPGYYLLSLLPEDIIRKLVSAIAILFSLVFLGSGFLQKAGFRIHRAAAGLLSGLFGGIGALTGPPIVLHFMLQGTLPHVIRANLIIYFLIIDFLLAAVAVTSFGNLTDILIPLIVTMVVSILGALIGQRIALAGEMPWYKPTAVAVITTAALISLLVNP